MPRRASAARYSGCSFVVKIAFVASVHEQRRAACRRPRATRRSRRVVDVDDDLDDLQVRAGHDDGAHPALDRIARLPLREHRPCAARAARCREQRAVGDAAGVAQDRDRARRSRRRSASRADASHRARSSSPVRHRVSTTRIASAKRPSGRPASSAIARVQLRTIVSVAAGIGQLALVRQQRLDLAVDRVGDVDVVRRLRRGRRRSTPRRRSTARGPRRASSGCAQRLRASGYTAATRRLARREVIGMARVDAVPVAIGRLRHHAVAAAPAG